MIYDTSKLFINTLAESLISLSGIQSGPVALFTLSDWTILFVLP